MTSRDECVEVQVETPVRRATAKAILVKVDETEVWVPQSLVHEDSEVYGEGHTGTLIVPEWFAKKEGLV